MHLASQTGGDILSLLSARKKAGLSQQYVAQQLGITPVAVSNWETGRAMPRSYLLPHIAELYGCTVDELLEDE